jgi:hypothetical protein
VRLGLVGQRAVGERPGQVRDQVAHAHLERARLLRVDLPHERVLVGRVGDVDDGDLVLAVDLLDGPEAAALPDGERPELDRVLVDPGVRPGEVDEVVAALGRGLEQRHDPLLLHQRVAAVVELDLDALAVRQRGHLDPRESRGRRDQQPDGQKTQFETHVVSPFWRDQTQCVQRSSSPG